MFTIKKIGSKREWERAVSDFDNATFLDSWAWGEYQQKIGRIFKRFAVIDKDKVVALIPLTVELAKRSRYLRIEHGPLMNWENSELTFFVVNFLKSLAHRHKLWYIRINPQIKKSKENEKILKSLGFIASPVYYNNAACTQILDLTKPAEDLLKTFRKSTRERIRQSLRRGLTVEITDSDGGFEIFSKLYLETVFRNKWNAESVLRLRQEFEILRKHKMVKLFLVKYTPDDRYVAASFTVLYQKQLTSLYSGTSSLYRKLPLAYLIRWEHIKYAQSLKLTTYNFWGIAPPNASSKHPWARLSEFKRGFRGRYVQYIGAWDLPVNRFLTTLIHLYEWVRDKHKGYL